jgi:hypothetical protein
VKSSTQALDFSLLLNYNYTFIGETMQDYLKDIVQHTYGLGNIELAKVVGTATETKVSALADGNLFVLDAKFKNPVPEFVGTFGMPNLGKLKTILDIPEYREGAKLSINSRTDAEGNVQPEGIHFENAAGDFKNDFRFMIAAIINDKLKTLKMRPVNWHVSFAPTNQNIQRLRFQASANSEETTFIASTDNQGNLRFSFGNHASHAGDFVFQSGVSGAITKSWNWPVGAVMSILNLSGDKTFKMSDDGAMMITVDSGLAEYNYTILAQTK